MNAVGKTLVILNFIFAAIVGGLLVVDFATRNNWKQRAEEIQAAYNVLKAGREATHNASGNVAKDLQTVTQERENFKEKLRDEENARKADQANFEVMIADYKQKLVDKDLAVAASKELSQRLTNEVAVLRTTIKDRETTIVDLEASVKTFRLQASNFEALARTRQTQNENLLEQLREVTLALNKKEAGVADYRLTSVKPNEPNPPAVKIEGKIQKVAGTMVEITLGTDHGLKENNTLDVYRMDPQPTWLGMIRITDARHHISVGRLVPANAKVVLKEGDFVTSKIK